MISAFVFTSDVSGIRAGYGLRTSCGGGSAAPGWRPYSFAIAAGARQDDRSHRGHLLSLRPSRRVGEEDTDHVHAPCTPRTMMRVEAAGTIYKKVQSFNRLGGAVTGTPVMSTEIAMWTRAYWMRIRRYLRELYDQPKVALSLKTRMVKAGTIKVLLYGCSAWTLYQKHYTSNYAPCSTGSCFALSGYSARDQITG